MFPLIGLIAAFFFGLLSAGAAAGKIIKQQRSKRMMKRNNQTASPSQELNEDLENRQLNKSVSVSVAEEEEEEEVDVVAELMKVHKLSGPAVFLYTIEEETSSDLRSEDSKSQGLRTRMCLKDLMTEFDGNFMTPIPSPVKKSTRALVESVGSVNPTFDCTNMKLCRNTKATSF